MNKLITFAAIGAFAVAGAAFANDTVAEDAKDVKDSVGAIHKDNKVIKKHQKNVNELRASKAANKAEGDHLGQAADSVKIGANQATIAAKKGERNVDEKILEHDKEELRENVNGEK